MERNRLSWEWIINTDETRVTIEGSQHRGKKIESTLKRKAGAVKAVRGKGSTYIPFVASDGTRVMDV